VKRADEVDGDDALEAVGAVRATRAGEPLGVTDAGAVNRDPQAAGRVRRGERDGLVELLGPRDVGRGELRALAEFRDERLAANRVQVGDEDVRAATVQRTGRGLAQPGGTPDDERG